jgi:hypothetical protein
MIGNASLPGPTSGATNANPLEDDLEPNGAP